jgi:hypothetical protein
MFKTFEILNFDHWDLPFDLAQGGEPVEPFVIWDLNLPSGGWNISYVESKEKN